MTHTYPCSLRPRIGNNPQRELQEMTEYWPFHPEYNLVEDTGPDHYPIVIYQVVLGGRITEGIGGDAKDAKHAAAKRMLQLLDDDGGQPYVVNTANVDDDLKNNHQNVQNVDVCQNMALLQIHADDDQHQTVDVSQNMAKVGIHDDNGDVDASIITSKPKLRAKVGQNVPNVDDDKNNHQNVQNVDVCQNMALLQIHADDDQQQTVDVIQNMAKGGIHDVEDSIINSKAKLRAKVGQNVQVKQNNFGGAGQSVYVKQNISRWKR